MMDIRHIQSGGGGGGGHRQAITAHCSALQPYSASSTLDKFDFVGIYTITGVSAESR